MKPPNLPKYRDSLLRSIHEALTAYPEGFEPRLYRDYTGVPYLGPVKAILPGGTITYSGPSRNGLTPDSIEDCPVESLEIIAHWFASQA